ncbi:MAG: GWxTD domain-containing protein [Ignavibacteriales bacterium]|nr:MAG: GWxTD domain-containing protein [Ignavibacteriales bacterium]
MILRIFTALLIFLSSSIFAQNENGSKQNSKMVKTNYYLDFLNFRSDQPGMTRLDVFIQVPYSEVQFVKSANGFSAAYSLTVSVFDENKEKLISEKSWTEKLDVAEFDQTLSKNNFNLSLRSFNLVPGKYLVRTSLEDKDSREEFTVENTFVVSDLSNHLALSDAMIISRKDTVNGSVKILPNVSKSVLAQRDGVPLFFEVYSRRNQKISVEYDVINPENKTVFATTELSEVDSGKTQTFYTLKDLKLDLGVYAIRITLKNAGGEKMMSTTKKFNSRWIGVPENISDMNKAVDQLVYIASSSELDFIKEGENPQEVIKRYLDFWKSKDPSAGTEENEIFNEYYRRISYCNEKFSHYSEGWKTDRGMVFILLGPPSNVDRHPFDYDSKPYEVWDYYDLNRSFVFVDETGFGDYRLITPLHGDLYKYRP